MKTSSLAVVSMPPRSISYSTETIKKGKQCHDTIRIADCRICQEHRAATGGRCAGILLAVRAALELACNGKGTRGNYLGLFAGTLLLSGFMPFDGLTADALGDRVLAFADAALAVRAALAAPAAPEPAPAPAAVPPDSGFRV